MGTTVESPLMHWDRTRIKKEMELLKGNHYVVLDIETTGLSPHKGGRIIEIGAVRIVNGEIQDKYQTFVDPEQKIYPKTTELTGITQEMVNGQPTIGQVLGDFAQWIGDAVVVCHNAKFDWSLFLKNAFKSIGLEPKNTVICTYELFRKADPGRGKGGYTLMTLCTMFKVTNKSHHRAIDDAIATAEVFLGIQSELIDTSKLKKVEVNVEEVKVEHTEVNVKRVKYWEKQVSPRKMMKRHYVNLANGKDYGSVYFDIPTKTWYNRDFEKPLDFKQVEKRVLEFLELSSVMDLCSYKN